MKNTNILIELLKSLKVKYTSSNAMDLYMGHPHRNNLYGLSEMLTLYGVENIAIRLEDKKQICDIETPFIAHAGNDFVLVKKIYNGVVDYLWHDKNITVNFEQFKEIWSGILLVAEANENSIEPDYLENRKKEIFDSILSVLLYVLLLSGGLLAFINADLFYNLKGVVVCLLLVGIYVCFLLLQKQMKIQSNYADKLCSLFKKSDCNNVLESEAAKFLGVFSWSEIGFGYFVSTLLIYLFFPQWIPYSAWIHIFTLPYTLWSVWFQSYRVKQWCPMCLIVMCIFWLVFILNLLSGSLYGLPVISISSLWIFLLYGVPFLITRQLVSLLAESYSRQKVVYEMNAIKLNEDVFMSLLKQNQHYEVVRSTSRILFGNVHAENLITVLTNPHCEPCARMHIKIRKLLHQTGGKFCIQYVFSSFKESLNMSNKMLISAFMKEDEEGCKVIYDDWFKDGKNHKEKFFKEYDLQINDIVEEEFNNHQNWIKQCKLRATPTVLINGYILPEQYKIEDLILLNLK
ncbi:vitamin K epoxide reductase family protein [uncultured Parabacteroides sp.]|uniref:vitamin K epoxide reductase family protein n=1 Tax=uncultured Parabacteroides sp. TaxID=512312 RepID=UPI0025DE30E9|nr:vitamin K epoxide reductase family protein [uncultured Parabacteroides sp.]